MHWRRSSKYWLVLSVVIVAANLVVFAFRKHLDTFFVLAVVLLTPVALILLYFLTNLLNGRSTNHNRQNRFLR